VKVEKRDVHAVAYWDRLKAEAMGKQKGFE
jgi:hypothetical protein